MKARGPEKELGWTVTSERKICFLYAHFSNFPQGWEDEREPGLLTHGIFLIGLKVHKV